MKRTLVLLTLCLLAAGAVARAADVKEIYDKQCAKCHGTDGKGETKMGKKVGVKDYTSAKVQSEMTDEEMAKVIKQGKKQGDTTKMKAFPELSDADVKGLIAHIRSFKK